MNDPGLDIPSPTQLQTHPKQGISRKVVLAGMVGTIAEYYDFGVYGYMATVLAVILFHSSDPTSALLATLAVFAVAFFLRTPGGILFGHIGDKYGRKRALAATILLMCAATVGVGLLPTYASIGVWATVLVVVLRCAQGVAAGGELGGAASLVSESAPTARRAFFTSFIHIGSLAGALIASLAVLALNTAFTDDQIHSWAWRLPFLLSIPMAAIGLWIRYRISETPQFISIKDSTAPAKPPLRQVISVERPTIFRIFLLSAIVTGGYYVAYVYGAIYLVKVGHFSSTVAFWSTAITISVSCAVVPCAGWLGDRIGRRPLLIASGVLGIVIAWPAFTLMGGGQVLPAILGHAMLGIPVALSLGVSFAVFAELLPANIRYTGIALGFNISQMALGGTAPFISTWLVRETGSGLAPAALFTLCGVLSLAGVVRLRETKGQELAVA